MAIRVLRIGNNPKIPQYFAASMLKKGFGGLQLHFTYPDHCCLGLPPAGEQSSLLFFNEIA